MSMLEHVGVKALLASALVVGSTMTVLEAQDNVQLGQPVTEQALQEWDLIVLPDGTGLPEAKGTGVQGKAVYEQKCAACHGSPGPLAAGAPVLFVDSTSEGSGALRTVGNYWPYASTLFDYVRRAMPATAPKSLSNEEVYQVVAYVLAINGIIAQDLELNNINLPQIEMPNRDGFVDRSQIQ